MYDAGQRFRMSTNNPLLGDLFFNFSLTFFSTAKIMILNINPLCVLG